MSQPSEGAEPYAPPPLAREVGPDDYLDPAFGTVPADGDRVTPPPGEPARVGAVVLRVVLAAALGAAIALLGAATHRTLWNDLPVGLVLALALTLSTAVLCRAWSGGATLTAAALGWIVAVQLISLPGRGGDVIVTDPSAAVPWAWAGVAWSYVGIVLFGVVVFLPRRWFAHP